MSRNVKDRPGVRPLRELCQRALMANIGRLRHLGWVPQYLVADALSQCTAEQLEAIEQHNPHIIADNEPLWMAHCAAKYKELRELQLAISSGAAPPVPSWRTAYWDMRRQDEIRAQQIMERVRTRTAEIERERDARKVRVLPVSEARTRLRGAAARPGAAAKGSTLVQHARIMTKAHMQMFQPAQSPGRAQSPPPQPAMHRKHMSPSGSPAQSPPYNSSPPYYSSS
ncbi:Elongin-A, partial [Coemansia spiralis]